MLIPFMISKIHKAKVTGADLNYAGSIGIDEEIMTQANLKEFQKVEVYNITNGNRLSRSDAAGMVSSVIPVRVAPRRQRRNHRPPR